MVRALRKCLLLTLSLLGSLSLVGSPALAQGADGTWTNLPIPSARYAHGAVFDPVRHRMLMLGGYGAGNDLWQLSEDGTWTQLEVSGSPSGWPIYDPLRDRILTYGSGSVRQLSLEAPYVWTVVSTSGGPATAQLTPIYDPAGDRMIVFGGGTSLNDVWQLTLSGTPTWSKLTPQGAPPGGRTDWVTILDTARDRALVFGGAGYNPVSGSFLYNDVWALSLSGTPTWSQVATAGTTPSKRADPVAIYDPVHDRMILYGGRDFPQPSYDDCYQLSLSGTPTWSEIPWPGANGPWFRYSASAVYDSAAQRMIVFGGRTFSETFSGVSFNDTWQLSLSGAPSWSSLSASPPPEIPHIALYDGPRDRMLVFGGTYDPEEAGPFLNLWELVLSGTAKWSPIAMSGDTPVPGGPPVYDPVADRMLVFGNTSSDPGNLDVWQLPLSGTPIWSRILPSGTPPANRGSYAAVYDPTGNRVILFGGASSGYYADTWALDLNGTPSWVQLFPANAPPSGRAAHSSIYDPARHRMVVFGGSNGSLLNDLWELTLDGGLAWNPLVASGVAPVARETHAAIYDPVRDRMVVFGGYNGSTYLNDSWELQFSAGPTWNQLSPTGALPGAYASNTGVYDAVRDRLIVWGGPSNEVSFLTWGDLVSAPPAPISTGSRLVASPNPFRSKLQIQYTIAAASRASVRVFDVAGRERASIADGMHAASAYERDWDGRDRSGKRLPSGVYLIELQTPDRTESIRVVHIE